MIMTIIVRYKEDSSYKNNYTDIMIGEICSTKDKYEILHPLLCKLKPGFEKMGFDSNGNSNFSVLENRDSRKMILKFKNDKEEISNTNLHHKNYELELWMVGDIKFLMMVCGREGYDKSWCLCCSMSCMQMNLHHKKPHKDDDYSSLNLWTTQKLRDKVKENNMQISLGKRCNLEGIKIEPFLILYQ